MTSWKSRFPACLPSKNQGPCLSFILPAQLLTSESFAFRAASFVSLENANVNKITSQRRLVMVCVFVCVGWRFLEASWPGCNMSDRSFLGLLISTGASNLSMWAQFTVKFKWAAANLDWRQSGDMHVIFLSCPLPHAQLASPYPP